MKTPLYLIISSMLAITAYANNINSTDAGLLGLDSNQNGVRDDYELAIRDLTKDPLELARLTYAGVVYQNLLSAYQTSLTRVLTTAELKQLLADGIEIEMCQSSLTARQVNFPKVKHLFFNTLERTKARWKIDKQISAVINYEYIPDAKLDWCAQSDMKAIQLGL